MGPEDPVLFHDSLVCRFNLGGRDDDWTSDAVTLDGNELRLFGCIQERVGVGEVPDFFAIYLIDYCPLEAGDEGGQPVTFYPRDDDNVCLLYTSDAADE